MNLNKYRAIIAYRPIHSPTKDHFDAFADIEGETFEDARDKLFREMKIDGLHLINCQELNLTIS